MALLPKLENIVLPRRGADLVLHVVGDTGHVNEGTRSTSQAMVSRIAATGRAPNAVLLAGDNFYPSGVWGDDDPRFLSDWRDVFITGSEPGRRALASCPWFVVLGNHDIQGNIEAQVNFTTSDKNPGGVWRLPHRSYHVDFVEPSGEPVASLFALDTNGCQRSCLTYTGGDARGETESAIRALAASLKAAPKLAPVPWRLAFGHHPMFTTGRLHSIPAACLRERRYTSGEGRQRVTGQKGFGLETIFANCGMDAYFAGHEHVFQHKAVPGGCHHFVCGASGGCASGRFGGRGGDRMTWVDEALNHGFVEVVIPGNNRSEMTVTFCGATGTRATDPAYRELRTVTVARPGASQSK